MKNINVIIMLLTTLLLASCETGFDPIDYGHDACAHCKMTIIDKRYASETVTKKGKVYKFDDIICLRKYMSDNNFPTDGLLIFVADYSNPDGKFLEAKHAMYIHHEIFKSPMNGGYAAFAKSENGLALKDSLNADLLKWENLN